MSLDPPDDRVPGREPLACHLDEARWPPPGRAELAPRFGCGFVGGLVLGFGLLVAGVFGVWPPGRGVRSRRPVAVTAVVGGVLAAWQWERFWRWWARLASWLS